MVLENLEERGFISPYQFGIEVVTDEEGNIITKPKDTFIISDVK